MNKIKAIVLGAGGRGNHVYGDFSLRNPDKLKIVGVAEPNEDRRNLFMEKHKLDKEYCFSDWKEVFQKDKFADLVCVCTQDRMHVEPTIEAMKKGYDILLEKPIAPTYQECELIEQKAKEYGVSVAVAHVLRYTPFFTTLKRLIDNNDLGRMKGVQHNENIGYIHFAHAFVRGNWRNESLSTPMILAKSCHDMDIMYYLIGSKCTKLSSYGSTGYFSKENKPKNSPLRCLDNCPYNRSCPYYAPKIYLTCGEGWPTNLITTNFSKENIIKELEEGQYGRCVFSCDNDMTEHQVVSFKFENGVTAVFTMSAFTTDISRTLKIAFEKGEIRGHMEKDEIEVVNFVTGERKVIQHLKESYVSGHGGGDDGFMNELIDHLIDKENNPLKSSIDQSLHSHLMAFSAHESMKIEKEIDLDNI